MTNILICYLKYRFVQILICINFDKHGLLQYVQSIDEFLKQVQGPSRCNFGNRDGLEVIWIVQMSLEFR